MRHIRPPTRELRIPIAVSARHVHPSRRTLDLLFGAGYQLRVRHLLSQPGQFAAHETVAIVGPRGRIERVRLLGPPREEDQVELSRSDEIVLGLQAPLRVSGDLKDTPGVTLVGPSGTAHVARGVVTQKRHIHMSPEDAQHFGVTDRQCVSVAVDSDGRDLVFADVVVRVSPDYRLELHLDTDEANAAGVATGAMARLVSVGH